MSEDLDTLLTADELAAAHPPHACELVAGRIVAMSPAGVPHGLVVGRLNMRLCAFVAAHDLGLVTSGETGYWVCRDPDTVRAPDLAYVSHATIARWRDAGTTYFPGAPDLAVEGLSPDDRWLHVEQKVHEYLHAGGATVWVLNPVSRTVHVFDAGVDGRALGDDGVLSGGDVLPGFETPIADLFDA